jgi:hypothetical protein
MERKPEGNFHDDLIDRVPYEEMPYELLLHQEAQGDRRATAEIRRRADAEVERMVQERLSGGGTGVGGPGAGATP